MKFKIGDKVRVTNPYSGGNFADGDIVEVAQIGFEDEDCYGAISPYDGEMWYLNENEVSPATNANNIRSMDDEELAKFLMSKWFTDGVCKNCDGNYDRCGDFEFCTKEILKWLKRDIG